MRYYALLCLCNYRRTHVPGRGGATRQRRRAGRQRRAGTASCPGTPPAAAPPRAAPSAAAAEGTSPTSSAPTSLPPPSPSCRWPVGRSRGGGRGRWSPAVPSYRKKLATKLTDDAQNRTPKYFTRVDLAVVRYCVGRGVELGNIYTETEPAGPIFSLSFFFFFALLKRREECCTPTYPAAEQCQHWTEVKQ